MVSSSFALVIDAALEATGDEALSYVHHELKGLIRSHLFSLLIDFPTLSPYSDTFTDDEGTSARLLHAHGLLPIPSSSPDHVLVTIWLHRAYPFNPPMVFVFPTNDHVLLHDHPFLEPSGAVVASPYLYGWQFPESNLADLAHNLVDIFTLCHPYIAASNTASRPRRDEAIGQLSSDDEEVEGFEAVDEKERCMLEDAAASAIDDEMYALDKALEARVLDFESYIKVVRSLAREQFFHIAWVAKLRRSSGRL